MFIYNLMAGYGQGTPQGGHFSNQIVKKNWLSDTFTKHILHGQESNFMYTIFESLLRGDHFIDVKNDQK